MLIGYFTVGNFEVLLELLNPNFFAFPFVLLPKESPAKSSDTTGGTVGATLRLSRFEFSSINWVADELFAFLKLISA